MTGPDERAFRALLRWYPRRWREQNEEVVLGTMLDDAEARGQEAPDAALRRATILDALAARLDLRTARMSALAGLVATLAAAVLLFAGNGAFDVDPSGISAREVLNATLGAGVAAMLAWLTIVALARNAGLVSGRRALAALVVSLPGFPLAVASHLAWSERFDDLDERTASDAFAAAWPLLALGAWLFGTAAIALVADAALRTGRVPAAAAVPVAIIAGGVVAVVAYAVLRLPHLAGVVLLALLLVALLTGGPRRSPTVRDETSGLAPDAPGPRAERRMPGLGRALAASSAVVGIMAVAFAMSGPAWPGIHLDGTGTMRVGIAAGLLACIPLTFAFVALAGFRRGPSVAGTLVSVTLAASALNMATNAINMPWGWWLAIATTIPAGVAFAAIVLAISGGHPRAIRITAACSTAVVFSLLVGPVVVPAVPFIAPVVAIIVAVRPATRRSRGRAIAAAGA